VDGRSAKPCIPARQRIFPKKFQTSPNRTTTPDITRIQVDGILRATVMVRFTLFNVEAFFNAQASSGTEGRTRCVWDSARRARV